MEANFCLYTEGSTQNLIASPTFTRGFWSINGPNFVDMSRTSLVGTFVGPAYTLDGGGTVISLPAIPSSLPAIITAGTVDGVLYTKAFSQASLPSTANIAAGNWAVFKDTSGGGVYVAYNDAGTIKKVALT